MVLRSSIQEINYHVGWLTWRCASLFYLYQFILRVFTGVIAQDIMLSLHLTLMQILIELLSDRHDTRKSLIVSIFSCILGNLCLGYVDFMMHGFFIRSCIKNITLFFPSVHPPILSKLTVTLALGFVVSFFVKKAYFLFEQKSRLFPLNILPRLR